MQVNGIPFEQDGLASIEKRSMALQTAIDNGAVGYFFHTYAYADVDDFLQISDVNEQRFAANHIVGNFELSAGYKFAFEEMATDYPGLLDKVLALDALNQSLLIAKHERKSLDVQCSVAFQDLPAAGDWGLSPGFGRGLVIEALGNWQQVDGDQRMSLDVLVSHDEFDDVADLSCPLAFSGLHSGPIKALAGNLVGQKTGRDPNVLTWHERANLQGGADLKIDDMADIKYSGGVGAVSVRGQGVEGAGVGR